MHYWEFIFVGKDSEDFHGLMLRESIRKIASKFNKERKLVKA